MISFDPSRYESSTTTSSEMGEMGEVGDADVPSVFHRCYIHTSVAANVIYVEIYI